MPLCPSCNTSAPGCRCVEGPQEESCINHFLLFIAYTTRVSLSPALLHTLQKDRLFTVVGLLVQGSLVLHWYWVQAKHSCRSSIIPYLQKCFSRTVCCALCLQIFLFDHSNRVLLGPFSAATDGGMGIDPKAWGRRGHATPFPAQVCTLPFCACN